MYIYMYIYTYIYIYIYAQLIGSPWAVLDGSDDDDDDDEDSDAYHVLLKIGLQGGKDA